MPPGGAVASEKIGITIEVDSEQLVGLQKDLDKTAEEAKAFAKQTTENDKAFAKLSANGLPQAQSGFAGLSAGAGASIAAVTAVVGVVMTVKHAIREAEVQFFEMAKASAEATLEMNHLGKVTGTSVEWISQMAHAAKASHLTIEQLHVGLATMTERAAQTPEAFTKLGISVRDVAGNFKDTKTLTDEISDKMSHLGSASERAALAQELMGRAGKEMVPLLERGSAGLQAMADHADAMGVTVTKASVVIAEKWNHALIDTEGALDAVKRTLADDTLPIFTQAAQIGTTMFGEILKWVQANKKALIEFAKEAVIGLANSFALAAKAGSALSYVVQGLTDVVTTKYDVAFEGARAIAASVARGAEDLEAKLRATSKASADAVEPVEKETGARQKLVATLSSEALARAKVINEARDAIGALNEQTDEASHALARSGMKRGTLADARAAEETARANLDRASEFSGQLAAQQEASETHLDELKKKHASLRADAEKLASAEVQGVLLSEQTALQRLMGDTSAGLQASIEAKEKTVQREIAAEYKVQETVKETAARQKEALTKTQADYEKSVTDRIALEKEANDKIEAEQKKSMDASEAAANQWIAIHKQISDEAAMKVQKSGMNSMGGGETGELSNLLSKHAEYLNQRNKLTTEKNLELQAEMDTMARSISTSLGGAMVGNLKEIIRGTKSVGDAFIDMAETIITQVASMVASMLIFKAVQASLAAASAAASVAEGVAVTLGGALVFAADGGLVTGGIPGKDSVPAMLTPGEFVIPADVVSRIRGGAAPDRRGHFADGGMVSASNGLPMQAGGPQTVNISQPAVHFFAPMTRADFARMYRDVILPEQRRMDRLGYTQVVR